MSHYTQSQRNGATWAQPKTQHQAPGAAEYLTACDQCSSMLKHSEIKAYSCKYESGLGRTVYVETDQGWNPEPFHADAWYVASYSNSGTTYVMHGKARTIVSLPCADI